MSYAPDKPPAPRLSTKDAERACRELSDQVERVRDLFVQYRRRRVRRPADDAPH
jgi:hypothetical protein